MEQNSRPAGQYTRSGVAEAAGDEAVARRPVLVEEVGAASRLVEEEVVAFRPAVEEEVACRPAVEEEVAFRPAVEEEVAFRPAVEEVEAASRLVEEEVGVEGDHDLQAPWEEEEILVLDCRSGQPSRLVWVPWGAKGLPGSLAAHLAISGPCV